MNKEVSKQGHTFNDIPIKALSCHLIPHLSIAKILRLARTSKQYYENLVGKHQDISSRSISEADIALNPSLPLFKLIDGCRSLSRSLYLFRDDIQHRWREDFVRWANDNDKSQDSIMTRMQIVQSMLRGAEKLEYHTFPRKTAMIVLYFFIGFLNMGIILSFTYFLFLISSFHKFLLELSLMVASRILESSGDIVGSHLSKLIHTGITDREFLETCTVYGARTSLSIAGILFFIRSPIISFFLIPILICITPRI